MKFCKIGIYTFFIFAFFNLNLYASVFDTIRHVSVKHRPDFATDIFYEKVIPLDSVAAIKALDFLENFARDEKDKELAVVALQCKGVFYYHIIPNTKSLGIFYSREALSQAEALKNKSRIAISMNQLGFLLFLGGDYNEGFKYLIQADNMMQEIGYENIHRNFKHLYDLGYAYFTINNLKKAAEYFEKSIHFIQSESTFLMNLYNELATIYQELRENEKASLNYRKALEISKNKNDSAAFGMISGNLGYIYLLQGETQKAKPLIEADYRLSIKYNHHKIACLAAIWLLKIQLKEKKYESIDVWVAEIERLKALADAEFRNISVDWMMKSELLSDYYRIMAQYHHAKNNNLKSYFYLDSILSLKDSMNLIKDENMLANLETQILTERYLSDLQLFEKENNLQMIIRNTIIGLAVLMLVFFLRFIYGMRKSREKERKIFQLEKQKAEEKLQNYKNMMQSYVERLKDKNKMIEQFQEGVSLSDLDFLESNNEVLKQLYKSIILTEEDWIKFKNLFELAYPGFISKLKSSQPDITTSEVRLIALLKLNLSLNEIANILGISPDSVNKTRQRLKRKLGLSSHKEIKEFIEKLH
jgi:tetratricopeptide (TPR) repeat protein/DNA-binding CsgD family transcriptional regulator